MHSAAPMPHVTVCVCTFRRPAMLEHLVLALQGLDTDGFSLSVVVADNDPQASARDTVQRIARGARMEIVYAHEPRQNIALARNEALRHARGDWVAFIDDDEFPQRDWLVRMIHTCEATTAAGVLGPVRPHFERPPPAWILKGRFCDRPEHRTGRPMAWQECRTGNVLLRRSVLPTDEPAFREQFGTGGEDQDFFMRMSARGHVFRWCNEGIVHETVPPERWTRRYMLRRALLRGRNSLKHPKGRAALLAKSLLAVPAYTLILPMTLLMGHHVFMDACIRCCDHAGRLLCLVGLNPVRER